MSLRDRLPLRRLFSRRIASALLWSGAIVLVAVIVNLAGIHLVGGIEGWSHWLADHAGYFLVWRLMLYALTGCGWWRIRPRLLQRIPESEGRARLRRAEIAAMAALVLLEGSVRLQPA